MGKSRCKNIYLVPQVVHTWFSAVQFLPSTRCFPSPALESFFLLAFSLTELFLLNHSNLTLNIDCGMHVGQLVCSWARYLTNFIRKRKPELTKT